MYSSIFSAFIGDRVTNFHRPLSPINLDAVFVNLFLNPEILLKVKICYMTIAFKYGQKKKKSLYMELKILNYLIFTYGRILGSQPLPRVNCSKYTSSGISKQEGTYVVVERYP